jgi:hypothetical protein
MWQRLCAVRLLASTVLPPWRRVEAVDEINSAKLRHNKLLVGALGGIRTPDPQIRSLVLIRQMPQDSRSRQNGYWSRNDFEVRRFFSEKLTNMTSP